MHLMVIKFWLEPLTIKGKEEGRIIKILERVKKEYIGIIETYPKFLFFYS